MKIFICCSKHFYDRVAIIKDRLEKLSHEITLPNSNDEPFKEEEMRKLGEEEHRRWKAEMIGLQEVKVRQNDAVLVLNLKKNGQLNYIGGATFLEIFKAWELGKKIFLWNQIPDNLFKDELLGMNPCVIHGDVRKIN